MFDSKLLETIRALDTSEISEFLHSPFYNDSRNRKEVVQLFEWIILDHPECYRPELKKEAVHAALFKGKPFVENRLNLVMTALHRLIETFIANRFLTQDAAVESQLALARFYSERNLGHRFDSIFHSVKTALSNISEPDDHTLWLMYRLEDLRHVNSGKAISSNQDNNLISVLKSLDAYYITQRLINTAGLLMYNQLVKVDVSKSLVLFNNLSKWDIFHEEIEGNPLAQAYFRLLPLLADQADLTYATDFKQYIESIRGKLPAFHLKIIYTGVRIFLAVRYNQGDTAVLPLLFSNQKDEYEQGFHFEKNGMIRASVFQNIVTVALKLKHFDWIRTVMDECQHRITGAAEPENVLMFNEANYRFHTGDLEGALDTGFNLLKYDNYYYNLAARRLEVKIWYEKKDHDMAEYRLNALKSYLFSNKNAIPDQVKRNNDDFVDVFRQLMSPRNMGNPKRLAAIRENLHHERKHIAEREWFLEKLGTGTH